LVKKPLQQGIGTDDQSHVQCSEPFYKSTVLDEIAADPKADFEEKKRMMEMLKRFEDAQAEGEEFIAELDEEDEEEDELQKALDGLDIGEPRPHVAKVTNGRKHR
jgi:hypothetical protein